MDLRDRNLHCIKMKRKSSWLEKVMMAFYEYHNMYSSKSPIKLTSRKLEFDRIKVKIKSDYN